MDPTLAGKAAGYLQKLCIEVDSRRTGSPGNQTATAFVAGLTGSFGFEVTCPPFACLDWVSEGAECSVDGESFEIFPSPYALGCHVQAPLAVAETIEELEAAAGGSTAAGSVLLLQGQLTRTQLMPKNFPFYRPEEHQRIIAALEACQPAAVIASTGRDAELAGSGLYPFPLIADGDFDIPSVYMTDVEGARLEACTGQVVCLTSRATRIPASAGNVIARKGPAVARRVVAMAHIDTKPGTPGAVDNAGGVAVLLLLAELLAGYDGKLALELVAMNGEEYYASSGEQQYLGLNADRFGNIALGINVDGVGYRGSPAAYSLYDCPEPMRRLVKGVFARYDGLTEGSPWVQGDHFMFLMHQVPAVALTSDPSSGVMEVIHTRSDVPEHVDAGRLVEVALALHDLILGLNEETAI